MGTQCSCMQDPPASGSKPEVVALLARPDEALITPTRVNQYFNLPPTPLGSGRDSDANQFEDVTAEPDLPSQPRETKVFKALSRNQTNDLEKRSQAEDSNEPFSKKAVSFFRYSSLESRFHANPIEFANQQYGDVWKLQNIRLNFLIQKSQGKYLWEASNVATGKKCAVKVSLIDVSRLMHSNFTKTEALMKELIGIQNRNVIDLYSFSIWESEFHHKPCLVVVIVQELVKCSLRDVHSFKSLKGNGWSQNSILTILRDIYSGLVACKERQIVHGKVLMENVLIPETMDRVVLADFNMKLPIAGETRTATSTPSKSSFSKFVNGPPLTSEDATKMLSAPDDRDIFDLTLLILKLLTYDENVSSSYENLRKDERFKRGYQRVFEALDRISNKRIIPSQIVQEISELIEKKGEKIDLGLPATFDIRYKEDSLVESLFTKIDCYELLNQHETALEVYSELIKILENKDRKGVREYQEYVKCVNRTIKHYLSLNDWLKAKDVSNDLNLLLKKDEALKKTMKSYPKEYINFIFLLGNISEGLNETDKAIELYQKGLNYCVVKNIAIEAYSSALKRISNLYLLKKECQPALENLKKLVSFYETQEGYYVDKADAYLNIADISSQQGNFGQAVKYYIKSLENLKKGKLNNNYEAYLNVMDKIVASYKALSEDENALRYMIEALDFKKMLFGKESPECMQAFKEIGALQMKMKNYQGALSYYLTYHKSLDKLMEEQYVESLILLGDVYMELQEYEKAKRYYETYAELKEKTLGIESKEYLSAQDQIANILFREGDYKESLDKQLKIFAIKELMFKAEDLYIVISLSNIGDTYFASDDCHKALEYHQKSLKGLEYRKEELREEYGQLLLKIAFDLEKRGDHGEAQKFIYQSFQMSNKNGFDSDMEKTIEMYEMLSKAKEIKLQSLDFMKLAIQYSE